MFSCLQSQIKCRIDILVLLSPDPTRIIIACAVFKDTWLIL